MPQRVVITGTGAVTPLGLTVRESIDAVWAGHSGIRQLTGTEFAQLPVRIGGEVLGFDPHPLIPRSQTRRLDPHSLYGISAGIEALTQAVPHWQEDQHMPWAASKIGVSVGTSAGPVTLIQEATRTLTTRGPARVAPGVVVYGGADATAAALATLLGVQGPARGVSATCASGAVALGEALRALRHGYLEAALVIGAEHCITPVNIAANANIRALTQNYQDTPEQASRPFNRDRSGFVMSSGAAAIMLETEYSARKRGARVLGTLLGYGASSDGYHATAPHPTGEGAVAAMRDALTDAMLAPQDVHHVNAHATSTPLGDASEVSALQEVFGQRVPPITATKAVTGHLLGAAGVFEAIVALESVRTGEIPPTRNLDDPEWELDIVTGRARDRAVHIAMSNSFGFGGHNASLIIGRSENELR